MLCQTGEGSLTFWSTSTCRHQHEDSEISSPRKGGILLGFVDEVDAASSARGDWRWDPDGNDSVAVDVN